MPVDISQHLRNPNYPASVQRRRVLWACLQPFFRWSPRPCHGWRVMLLRWLGAKIGQRVQIYPSARVMFPWNLAIADDVIIGWEVRIYSLALISIADNVLISQGAHLCAGSHDHRQPNYPLVLKPVTVESGAWLAAECFIGPGVTVGAGAVVAARSVVVRDVPAGVVVAGNPARQVGHSSADKSD